MNQIAFIRRSLHVVSITVGRFTRCFPTLLNLLIVVANMFSLPLGIMLHADVSISDRSLEMGLIYMLLFR